MENGTTERASLYSMDPQDVLVAGWWGPCQLQWLDKLLGVNLFAALTAVYLLLRLLLLRDAMPCRCKRVVAVRSAVYASTDVTGVR